MHTYVGAVRVTEALTFSASSTCLAWHATTNGNRKQCGINLKLQTSKKMFWRFSWLRFTQTTQAFTRTTEGFMKTSIMVWICYNIFESYTFALKLKFCPKAPPDWTTEESAAHHFHWKTYIDTRGIHPNDRGTHLKNCSFEFQSLRKNPKNLLQISTENYFKCIF